MENRRIEELLERGVIALEKLTEEELEIRVETLPPVCPHCEKIKPDVRVHEKTQQGPLAEFLVQAQCLNCNHVFYMIPIQSECVKSVEDARAAMAERVKIGGYEREDSSTAA